MIAIRDVAKVGQDMGPGQRRVGRRRTFAVQIAHALGAVVTGVCSTKNLDLVRPRRRSRHRLHGRGLHPRQARYDVVLDNVLNHPPSVAGRVLAPTGTFIPNSVGNTGGMFAGLPRMARAALMGLGSTNVKFVTCVVNRENLEALAALLESGLAKVVTDKVYPLGEADRGRPHVRPPRQRGRSSSPSSRAVSSRRRRLLTARSDGDAAGSCGARAGSRARETPASRRLRSRARYGRPARARSR